MQSRDITARAGVAFENEGFQVGQSDDSEGMPFTERQISTHDKSDQTSQAEQIAKGFIMAEMDPPLVEKKYIDPTIGYGIFAKQRLKKGDFVMEYQGDLITVEEAQRRGKQYDKEDAGSFIVYFRNSRGRQLCVDATSADGLGRFVNDGWNKEKNAYLKEIQSEGKPHVCLFAYRDIARGEEIRFDYGVPNLPWRNIERNISKGKTPSQAGNIDSSSKYRTPSRACGNCDGCKMEECRKCRPCQDMKKYGGPGVLKKKCIKRKCLNMSSSLLQASCKKARTIFHNLSASQPVASGIVEVCISPSATQPVIRRESCASTPGHEPSYLSDCYDSTPSTKFLVLSDSNAGTPSKQPAVLSDESVPTTQPVVLLNTKNCTTVEQSGVSCERKDKKMDVRHKRRPVKFTQKRRKRPPSSNKLRSSKKRQKSAYSSVTPKKTRSIGANNKIFKLSNKSALELQSPRDPRIDVYEFSTGSTNMTFRSEKEVQEAMVTDSAETNPSQETHQDVGDLDLDIAWFDAECGADSDDLDQNIQVCTQNDMSYLTQTRFKKQFKQGLMKTLHLKPRLLDDGNGCVIEDSVNAAVHRKDKSSKKKEDCAELLGKNTVCPNDKAECSQPGVETNPSQRDDENKETLDLVSHNVTKGKQGCSGKKKKKKSSFKSQTENSCGTPCIQRDRPQQGVMDNLLQARKNMLCKQKAESTSTDNKDGGIVSEMVGSYCQSMSEMLEFLEEIVGNLEEVEININQKKLIKKMKREKSRMQDLLVEISLACPDPDKTVMVTDANTSVLQPSQRKLEGDLAAQMLKNIYNTLMSQTAECYHEKLNETSYEIKVNFKKEEEWDMKMVESPKHSAEEPKDESFDTKPETWKDISVVVRYTKESCSEQVSQMMNLKTHIEETVRFLETKLHQLKKGKEDVYKIVKKTMKKIRKKMSKFSLKELL